MMVMVKELCNRSRETLNDKTSLVPAMRTFEAAYDDRAVCLLFYDMFLKATVGEQSF